MSTKYVYMFSEGNGSMRELLGGKGANLAEIMKRSLRRSWNRSVLLKLNWKN